MLKAWWLLELYSHSARIINIAFVRMNRHISNPHCSRKALLINSFTYVCLVMQPYVGFQLGAIDPR